MLLWPFSVFFNCSVMTLCALRSWLLKGRPRDLQWGNVLSENPIWHRLDTELLSPTTLPAAFGTSDSRILSCHNKLVRYMQNIYVTYKNIYY